MNVVALLGIRHLVVHRFTCISMFSRKLCGYGFPDNSDDLIDNGFQLIEEPLKHHWRRGGQRFDDAERVIEVLKRDEPGFDTKAALSELRIEVSWLLVREVLVRILRNVVVHCKGDDKPRWAKIGFKFFVWSECNEFMAMWKVVDEMTKNGLPTTARTFNILICTCGEAGLARRVVERFIQSKTFNYRPYKHCYNAILISLRRMVLTGFHPDILTYNVVMCAKYRLGELGEVWRLVDEMVRNGFKPDFHTYNIILHDEGIDPCVLHYTTLIDGLSRAGNIEACEWFFDEMTTSGCYPDVVCYTVVITGYVVAGEFEKARALFDDMIVKGQLPNGCRPNFRVYRTLVSGLRDAGRLREARGVVKRMIKKGQYGHLAAKIRGKKR
ncbi:Pentatricopeptide repeat-containing protein At3g60050 [Linum grandiflorum]